MNERNGRMAALKKLGAIVALGAAFVGANAFSHEGAAESQAFEARGAAITVKATGSLPAPAERQDEAKGAKKGFLAAVAKAFSGSEPAGMVSLDFDDAWKSQYRLAAPMLEKAGYRGTFYVISEARWPDSYMSVEQVRDLERRGHSIQNHTRSHPRLTELEDDELREEIAGAQDDLASWGIPAPRAIAYPYGKHDGRVIEAAKAAGLEYGRTTLRGLNTAETDPYALRSHTPDKHTTLEEIKANIDLAIATDSWYILSFHRIDEREKDLYSTDSEMLQDIIDYLKEKEVRVVTVEEGVRALGG